MTTKTTTADRLTELENRIFGEDCARGPDNLPLERGAGSKFASASDKDKALHAALVALIAAETEVTGAEAKLLTAKEAVAAAEKAVDAAGDEAAPKTKTEEPAPHGRRGRAATE